MLSKIVFVCVLLIATVTKSSVFAAGMTFGMVAKSIDDGNFIDAWEGCNAAAEKAGDQCVLLGGNGVANLRVQEIIIRDALKTNRFDAIAVSVINSEYVALALQDTKIPVITFDSPFNEKHSHLSRAYVGTDNINFGKDMAQIAKRLNPQGKSICLMTVLHDENLSLRVLGVRRELSEDSSLSEEKRLEDHAGWVEPHRCPWHTSDNTAKSLTQLGYSLRNMKPDIFLSVGHFPIIDDMGFRNIVEPYREEMRENKRFIIVGIGAQSIKSVEKLMHDDLVHGYVSIDFPEIGRKSYEVMKRITEQKTIEPINFIPNIIRVSE